MPQEKTLNTEEFQYFGGLLGEKEQPKLYQGPPEEFYADRDSSNEEKSALQKPLFTTSDTGASVGQGVINFEGMAE